MNGQVIRRDEADNLYPTSADPAGNGDPHEVWYRFAGVQMGYVGNNGTLDTDYQTSIENRTKAPPATPKAFRFGANYKTDAMDMALSLTRINSYDQGSATGSYTVREGDTLAGIAAQLWGDSSLWYKIAEANGMSAASGLAEGQRLTLPTGVMKSTHNASTFRPYDPSDATGDVNPSAPKPPKGNKCGILGQVMLVAVAVAVTALTAGAAAAAAAPGLSLIQGMSVAFGGTALGMSATTAGLVTFGAVGAAAGSIVSQGLGLATGIQDKFDFKAVGMAAIGGAVGGGLGGIVKGTSMLAGAARGALGSAATQGIGVTLGLQKKLDFAGIAAAAVSGGVGAKVSGLRGVKNMNPVGSALVTGTAGALSNAASRTLINGSDFGDNILAAMPDVIGSTIGNMIAQGVAGGLSRDDGPAREEAGSSASPPADSRARMLADMVGEALFGEMNAELDEIMIEFERSTSLDWEGSPAQAAHTRIKEALHAQIMSALTGGGAAPAPLEAGGYRENPFLDPMPTIPRSPTFSLSILNGWEAEYKASWQKSGGKYDPYNDALARKGFAANREYIAWLDRVADAQLARDMTDFGTEYWKISSMVIAPLGAVDTAYHILNGDMTAGEAAFALATMGKGRALKAAETTVIGRVKDLKALQSGERSLLDRLPDLGSPKANWKQNSGVLRQEMSLSRPIRDASPGDTGGQFLNAERNLLRDRGWTFDPKTYYWHPPKR